MGLPSKQHHSSSPPRATTTAMPPRQPRLRASCDGCFIAKVKCSKARPVCSRCLTVGLVCRYSPSNRSPGDGSGAGGKKHQQHPRQQSHLRPKGRRSVAAASSSTALLASTMSEESCRWLAQGAAGAAGGGGMMARLDGGIGGCAAAAAAAASFLGSVVVDYGPKGQHQWSGLGHMGEGMPLQIAPSVLSTMQWADMVAPPDTTTTTTAPTSTWSWPSSSASSSSSLAHQLSTWAQPEYATLPSHPSWQTPYWQTTQDAYALLHFDSSTGNGLRTEGDASTRSVG